MHVVSRGVTSEAEVMIIFAPVCVLFRPQTTPELQNPQLHSKMIKKGIRRKKTSECCWDTTRSVIHNAPFVIICDIFVDLWTHDDFHCSSKTAQHKSPGSSEAEIRVPPDSIQKVARRSPSPMFTHSSL